jgi:hypothetical protein
MGNTLLNSMVRGFGSQLGRTAANSITHPSKKRVTVSKPTLSEKQLGLIQDVEKIKAAYIQIQSDADDSYHKGNMTLTEYETIKVQVEEGLAEADAKIQSLSGATEKKGSVWPTVVGVIIGIYAVLWMLKAIKGL